MRVADGPVGAEQQLHAVASRIEEFAIAAHLGEAADDAGEDGIGLRFGNALLPHQDLPETDQRLEGAGQVGVERRILHFGDGGHLIEEQDDGWFGNAARFAEQRILAAVGVILARQAVDGGGAERRGAIAVDIADRHEDLERLVLHGFAGEGEEGFQHVVGLFPAGGQFGELAVVLALRMVQEEVAPHFEAAGNVGLAVGVHAQARGEQHHVGVGAEDGAGRTGTGDAAADGGVEALHARGVGEVILDRTLYAGERVVEAGEPAIVLGHQLVEERGALVGRGAGEFGPTGGGALAAGNDGLAVADFEHAAEEIEHVRVGFEAGEAGHLAHGFGGVGVQLGEAQIEAANRGVGDEVLDEVGALLILGAAPILGTEHDGDRGGVEIVGEGVIGAQRLLEVVQREAGVGGEEGARRR